MKNRNLKLLSLVMASAMAAGMGSPISARAEEAGGAAGEWRVEDGNKYWYENGEKQGTEGRGKEIYDPESDAWYWLDSVDGGKMAVSKDLYQESYAGDWAENEDGTGKWVRYDAEGHMIKGWDTNDDGTYYFDLTYGTMAKGNVEIEGAPCYFDEVNGIGVDCQWRVIDGIEYWYEGGVRQGLEGRGKEIHDPGTDAWYWLDSVDKGKKAVSKDVYQESEAGPWAENEDGTGKWVRYDENGHMIKSWNTNENGTYYFDPIYGTMAKGRVIIEGKDYIFDEKTGILQGGGKTHVHSYESSVTLEATCTGTGVMTYTCFCGNSYQETIPRKEHTYEVTKLPNGAGAEYTCSVCGTSYKNESTGVGTAYYTQEEIKEYMASSGASVSGQTMMKTTPNFSAPYDKGSVTEESLRDALAMLNQIRYIAGLDDVALDDEYTGLAQAGAFVNAVNNQMSHTPSQPSGMSDELYNDAYTGASSSNIAWSSRAKSLSYFVTLWMGDSDASNIDRVGHRRWILNPAMKKTGFGYAERNDGGTYSAVYAFDNWTTATDVQGVAWPAREMPVEYFSSNIAWSYSYGQSLSDVTVTLTCLNEGSDQKWSFSEIGYTGEGYFNVENSNYGQTGCVIFRPSGIHIEAGDRYQVIIKQGDAELANYTVNFF